MTSMHIVVRIGASVGLALALAGVPFAPTPAAAQEVPHHELDPLWPKLPFGERWLTGGLGGMCVGPDDQVIILNRQNVVPADLDGARPAPPVIELDPEGNVVRGWGDPALIGDRLHDCHVEADGSVWIVAAGTGVVQKYSADGSELLLQVGETGKYDSSDGTRGGRPLNSDRAQFFLPASLDVDPQTGDIYVADGETAAGNFRIAVLDRDGKFLRQWPLHRAAGEDDITPLPHCLRVSNDGLVYVCDRQADRIQVFDRAGRFVRNIDVPFEPVTPRDAGRTGTRGTAVVLGFSPDPEQRLLYVLNQNRVMVEVLDRRSGEVLASFGGGPGRYRGQFTLPHGIGVDSAGNVYVAEQEGRRIQKFVPAPAARSAEQDAVPRTPWGHPDLQGVWDFRTITPLERPEELGDREFLTAEEAASLEQDVVERDSRLLDRAPERTAAGGNVDRRADGSPGFYNNFWLDTGTSTIGTRRTSLIVDPPNGRLPELTASAQERAAAQRAYAREHPADSWLDLDAGDRCLLGLNAGPPIVPAAYNQNLQVFQTPDHVMLLTEMVHTVRAVPLDGRPPLPEHIRQWSGDARGRWEGDTLVIETANFVDDRRWTTSNPMGALGSSKGLTLVERLTRIDADTLEYTFTVTDPEWWTGPWTASIPMRRSDAPLFEYACHEGNYSMPNMLGGARAAERAAAERP